MMMKIMYDDCTKLYDILILEDDLPLDWTLRHGRSTALMVALKESAPIIYTDEYKEKINRTLLVYLMADRVSKCVHYLLSLLMKFYFFFFEC